MTHQRLGSALSWIAAAGFLGTAWLHSTGYDSVSQLASTGPSELRSLVPALWLSFSFNLLVVGLMVAVVAAKAPPGAALILILAALCPLSAAALQVFYLGFVPPTAILIGVGVITAVAGVASSRSATGSAYEAD